MRAFRVQYHTEVYRVLSELVLAKSETDIPEQLAKTSDKNFIVGHPKCEIIAVVEVSIDELPIRDLTVGALFALIDSRIAKPEPEEDSEAFFETQPKNISKNIIQLIADEPDTDKLKLVQARELDIVKNVRKTLDTLSPLYDTVAYQTLLLKCNQGELNAFALEKRITTLEYRKRSGKTAAKRS